MEQQLPDQAPPPGRFWPAQTVAPAVRRGVAVVAQRVRGWARRALDMVLPPMCLSCDALVDVPGRLCGTCWNKVAFLAPPLCEQCGTPFAFEPADGALCGACLAKPPAYTQARAVMIYDEHSRPLVLGFKHGDRLEGAPPFAAWLARAGQELLTPGALLVPVPLHRWRLWRRRYNQAALLALALAEHTGLACEPMMLERKRATPSQGGLSPAARARNVAGAFAVRPASLDTVAGAHIVLVDDVLTTGATVEACTRVLIRAGAARVDVLTLARVVR